MRSQSASRFYLVSRIAFSTSHFWRNTISCVLIAGRLQVSRTQLHPKNIEMSRVLQFYVIFMKARATSKINEIALILEEKDQAAY